MLAARYRPEAVGPVLATMNGLNPEQKAAILTQAIIPNGWSALMIAACYHHPEAVGSILAEVNGLNPEQKAVILTQTSPTTGWINLMLAAHHHPDIVGSVLAALNGLNPEQKVTILNQDGKNALMFAVHHNPAAVGPVLEAMNGLSSEQKAKILTKTWWYDGKNALMFAAHYHPDAVGPVLTVMADLSPEQKQQILLSTNIDGDNALELMRKHHGGLHPAFGLLRNTMNSMYSPGASYDLYDAPPKTTPAATETAPPASPPIPPSPASSSSGSHVFFSQGADSAYQSQMNILRQITGASDWHVSGNKLKTVVSYADMARLLERLDNFPDIKYSTSKGDKGHLSVSIKPESIPSQIPTSSTTPRPEDEMPPDDGLSLGT